ncbi:hypothetical protein ACH41H_34960 [Streptomyces sp. NPDC020800]|uniref:hypothetical protein n=1 Tax=Streptomyces sp. NPDC020800 TaxID=3365092 RepID=UPI0037A15858
MTCYKLHYVCVSCRVGFKRHPHPRGEHRCPNCDRTLLCAGHDFAAPPGRDARGWSVVAAVLGAGLRYEGLTACGCGKAPKYRPRTRADLRARRRVAAREGLPLAQVLSRPDPLTPTPC